MLSRAREGKESNSNGGDGIVTREDEGKKKAVLEV